MDLLKNFIIERLKLTSKSTVKQDTYTLNEFYNYIESTYNYNLTKNDKKHLYDCLDACVPHYDENMSIIHPIDNNLYDDEKFWFDTRIAKDSQYFLMNDVSDNEDIAILSYLNNNHINTSRKKRFRFAISDAENNIEFFDIKDIK